MDTPTSALNFMRRHRITRDRVDFSNMDSRQIAYEEQIFGRRTGGNAMRASEQYRNGKRNAEYWEDLAQGQKGYEILDVGCGQGYGLHFMTLHGLQARGLNLSVVEAELARHGRPNRRTHVMEWRSNVNKKVDVGSALRMPYEDESFDGVACYGVLMMIPRSMRIFDPEATFRPYKTVETVMGEVSRVLKPDGSLHLITMKEGGQQPERTEDYILFGENDYAVLDAHGKPVINGDTGVSEFVENAGLVVEKTGLVGKDKFWSIRARKQ